jgi:hypothetical protein
MIVNNVNNLQEAKNAIVNKTIGKQVICNMLRYGLDNLSENENKELVEFYRQHKHEQKVIRKQKAEEERKRQEEEYKQKLEMNTKRYEEYLKTRNEIKTNDYCLFINQITYYKSLNDYNAICDILIEAYNRYDEEFVIYLIDNSSLTFDNNSIAYLIANAFHYDKYS